MHVTVDVKGEATHEVDLEDADRPADGDGDRTTDGNDGNPADGDGGRTTDGNGGARPTYADLLADVGLSPHEVTVLVDGRPVPEDGPVAAERVTVLRLVKGG